MSGNHPGIGMYMALKGKKSSPSTPDLHQVREELGSRQELVDQQKTLSQAPLPAFCLWVNDAKLKKLYGIHQNVSNEEASAVWSSLPDSVREQWKGVEAAARSEYARAVRQVPEAAGKKASPVKKVKKGGKVEDPNAPKRAMSAFFFWMQENGDRFKKPGMGVSDVAEAAGVEWGKLTDKSKWEKKAAEDKKRYEVEIANYKKSQ